MKKQAISREITVSISGIGAGGDGVGSVDGRSVYVPKTCEGDVVQASVESENAEGIFARKINLQAAGPTRREAPCPHFERCGSCALQHIDEQAYRSWKIEKVQTTFARSGLEEARWTEPVFIPAASRRRVTFAVRKTKSEFFFGYNEARSHTILNVQTCLVLTPKLERAMQSLRPFLMRIVPLNVPVDVMMQEIDGALDLVLTGEIIEGGKFTFDQHEAFGEIIQKLGVARIAYHKREFGPVEILLQQTPMIKTFGALRVDIPPGAFLQASTESERALSQIVAENMGDAKTVADLFCGAGTFTGYILNGRTVTAIDSDGPAIAALQKAAHGQPQLKVERRDLFKEPLKAAELASFDAVIFDPPRAGAKAQAETLADSNVPLVIGVSCNPATFARDAKILIEGEYRLESLTLVDQFVYTAHSEIVGIFKRS